MAWITPIVNWIASNVLTPTDLNRIEGNTQDLKDNKVDKIAGKGLSTEDYTTAEKTKLSGIAAGAQVNAVTSVAGKTGAVTVTKSDVALGSVLNYGIATQAEAEAATSNVKYMTPLRVKEAIQNLGTITASGSYVGDGVTKTINVGFTPSMVLFRTVDATSTYLGVIIDENGGITSGTYEVKAIKITTGGFTVGGGLYDGNKSGYNYNWIAYS